MPSHLLLPQPQSVGSRRAGGGGGTSVDRDWGRHGERLTRQLGAVVATRSSRLAAGVDPDLVFKLRSLGRPADGSLEDRHLQVLGETRDYTYFVLADDGGATLNAALVDYRLTGNLRSLINLIENIEPYGPEDRLGPGLSLPLPTESVLVDVQLWLSANLVEAQARAARLEQVIASQSAAAGLTSQVLLRSITARRTIVRARLAPQALQAVLELSVVEQVRTPPVPFLDFRDWRTLSVEELELDSEPSGVVAVLDDAPATAHPLLIGLVESVDPIGPSDYPWQQAGQHGTEVVGRALFPHLEQELRDGGPLVASGTVRVGRILEPDPNRPGLPPRFATSAVPHDLVAQAIRQLHKQHGVRVFNLSVGYNEPYSDLHVGLLTETIDELVRELDIVVVVPTGNVPIRVFDAQTPSGHHAADDYPAYLNAPEHRLCEPGPAALAVTVGSVALSEATAEIDNRLGWQAVAREGALSPFSRTGPGVGVSPDRHNKPDLVHYGGNTALNDQGIVVSNDQGSGVLSTALGPDGRLFASCNGTSFAAPPVARVAADIEYAYPDASANLIRALLALSARHTPRGLDVPKIGRQAAWYGRGMPNKRRAVDSGGPRATMIYDGQTAVDDVQLHPLPLPDLFRTGSGTARTITLGLAFDPPVRRQRREYLAATMQVDLWRNIDFDQLRAMLRKQDPASKQAIISDRRRLTLEPGSSTHLASTVHVRQWEAVRSFIDDSDTFYVSVTHKTATWVRDDPSYTTQRYALAVTLEDEQLQQADLRQLLLLRAQVPTRVRLQS